MMVNEMQLTLRQWYSRQVYTTSIQIGLRSLVMCSIAIVVVILIDVSCMTSETAW